MWALGLSQDQSGKMSMEEFNWAYATLQQEVEEQTQQKKGWPHRPSGLNGWGCW